MGITGDMLVFVTMHQYGVSNEEKFSRAVQAVLDYAVWKMATYIYFNNGFECIRKNSKFLREYPVTYEFLRKSAIENYRLYSMKNATLEELMKELEKKNLPFWLEPGACDLFERLLKRDENPVMLLDRVIHFQHTKGGLFDEDVEKEREYAEKTLNLLIGHELSNVQYNCLETLPDHPSR